MKFKERVWIIYGNDGFITTVETSLRDANQQQKFENKWEEGAQIAEYALIKKKKKSKK